MAGPAEPDNGQRPAIVLVVFLQVVLRTTAGTGLLFQPAAAIIDTGHTPGVCALVVYLVIFPVLPHVGGVAGQTITLAANPACL